MANVAYDPNANTSAPALGGQNTVQKPEQTPVQKLRTLLENPIQKKKLTDILGQKGTARYMTTLMRIVSGSKELQKCSPYSIMAAALQNAVTGLSIDPAFGQAAIVPFNNSVKVLDEYGRPMRDEKGYFVTKKVPTATYQIMKNGYVQLAQRSGKYIDLNAGPVFEDEYKGFNIYSGRPNIENVQNGYRSQGLMEKIVGFFAYYKLDNGAEKVIYMTVQEIEVHARTYSKSYRYYPLKKHPIENDFYPDMYSTGLGWNDGWYKMAIKTVLRTIIRNWGPLTPEMEDAILSDSSAVDQDGNTIYLDGDEDDGEITEDTDNVPQLEAPDEKLNVPHRKAKTQAQAQEQAVEVKKQTVKKTPVQNLKEQRAARQAAAQTVQQEQVAGPENFEDDSQSLQEDKPLIIRESDTPKTVGLQHDDGLDDDDEELEDDLEDESGEEFAGYEGV